MKKIITLAFAAMMAMSAACFAAGDGSVLNKLQKPAEAMIAMFDKAAPTPYATVAKGLAPEAAKSFSEAVFDQIKKAAIDKFGDFKESKFVAFQRMDKADVVAYLGSFTKEKVVNLAFIFDKSGKMVNFQFTPVQAQPAKDAKKK